MDSTSMTSQNTRDPADLVAYVARSLVDNADAVHVTTDINDSVEVIHLDVAPSDLGQVIGKNGRIARSLRILLGASNLVDGVKRPYYELDIVNG